MPVHRREPDDPLEPLQLAHDQRAVRPGARVRDVEVVAVRFRGELGLAAGAAFLYEGAELGGLALELAGFVGGGDPVGYFFCGLERGALVSLRVCCEKGIGGGLGRRGK